MHNYQMQMIYLNQNLRKLNFKPIIFKILKIYHINELKIFNLNLILKNILTNENYKKLRNKIDSKFADRLIKNIIIENEKILNDRYSANIKINFDKDLIIQLLRNNKLSYVEVFTRLFFNYYS